MFSQACVTHSVQWGGGGRWATPKVYHPRPGDQVTNLLPLDNTPPPLGPRSQHLPPPTGQHLPPPPLKHLPPPPGPGHNTSLPPPPWDQVTTPPPSSPLVTRSQHLPLGPGHNTSPPPCAGGRYTSYWNAFLFR